MTDKAAHGETIHLAELLEPGAQSSNCFLRPRRCFETPLTSVSLADC